MDLSTSLQSFLIRSPHPGPAEARPPAPSASAPAATDPQLDSQERSLQLKASQISQAVQALATEREQLSRLAAKLGPMNIGPSPELQDAFARPLPGGPSPSLVQAFEAAAAARQRALQERSRAAQLWEAELARQAAEVEQARWALSRGTTWVQQALARPAPIRLVEPVIPLGAPRPRVAPAPSRRAAVRAPVQVAVDFEGDDNFYTGVSSDISEGGLFVATQNIRPLGEVLEIALALPSGFQIQATGRVRWIREVTPYVDRSAPSGMGIQFEGLSEEARTAIQKFLTVRDPILYED
jgi:uncharacterized protein (TIGR02266 family)